jgi:ABC-type molybdate transport system substrate-binding protein
MKSSGSYTEIPESFHPPIEQAAVVLKRSRQAALAQRFIDTLKKPENVRTLQSFGFAVPVQGPR